jgi:Protein of unknown function (DUF2800)
MTQSQDERLGLPSASSWRRYELCAGSWQLEAEARVLGQSAHETSPAAERGALIHAWLAGAVDEDGTEIKLDDSEQQTADFLQERATEQVHRIFGDEPTLEVNERRLWLTVNGQKLASGRFDRCVYTSSVALVQDFKTGWSEPDPAEQNSQMKVLAVLVALNLPSMLREVVVQIISGPFGVSEARYDLVALAKAYNEVLSTLRAIQDPLAALSPSPEACRYCPAINVCQAVKNSILAIAVKTQVSPLPGGESGSKLLDELEVVQGFIDAARQHYREQLFQDPSYDLPGWSLIPGAIRREVTDWEIARQRLAEWLDLEEINGAANYRLGDLERALGKKLKLRGPDLKQRVNEILQGLIEEKQNSASLKRIKSKALVSAELP